MPNEQQNQDSESIEAHRMAREFLQTRDDLAIVDEARDAIRYATVSVPAQPSYATATEASIMHRMGNRSGLSTFGGNVSRNTRNTEYFCTDCGTKLKVRNGRKIHRQTDGLHYQTMVYYECPSRLGILGWIKALVDWTCTKQDIVFIDYLDH